MGKHGALHEVGGHGRGDRFDKRETTRHGKGFSVPTGKLGSDFVDNGIKSTLVSSVDDDRGAKVPPKLISLVHA